MIKAHLVNITLFILLFRCVLIAAEPEVTTVDSPEKYHALIISGIGGDLKHSEKFQRIANELYDLLQNDLGYLEENIVYLAGDARKTDTNVTGQSTKINIIQAVAELKQKSGPDSQTLVFVVGHGDYRKKTSAIHLPKKDINQRDFGKLFADFPGKLVVVITTPASGPFMAPLSGGDRVIITATKAGNEINETYFPTAFIGAIKELMNSDDSTGSIAEVYSLARKKTEEYFKLRQMVLTEHSMLDDNADGEGTRELVEESADGKLAKMLSLGPKKPTIRVAVTDAGVLGSGDKWDKLRPPAVVLLHEIDYTVHSDLTYRIKERKQIKILNKGGHKHSDVIIFYNTAYETLSIESAKTVRADGTVDELNPSEILDVKATQTMMYTESRYKRFSMPSIEDGCVIDYTFVKTGENLHLSKDFWRTFIIEKTVPQNELRITFNIPKAREISHKFTKENLKFKMEKNIDEDKYSRTFSFTMKDIPPLAAEPKSPPVQELSTRLLVTSLTSWDDVWLWFKKISDNARDSNEEIELLVEEITAGKESDEEKAHAIYDWVSGNIRYIGLELGKHGYQPHKATSIFDNKFGDCKDKATLLLSMLDIAGIKGGNMVLIPTNCMAQVDTSMATLDQFNHAIATIIINGKRRWLDATGGETAFGDIPVSDQRRKVFVIGEDRGEFMVVPLQAPEENLLVNQSKLVLDIDGTIEGKDVITYTGAFSTAFRHKYKYMNASAQSQTLENVLSNFITAAKLVSYNIEGLNTLADKIVYTREYRSAGYAPKAGDLLILNLPLQKVGMQEIVATSARNHPLVIGQTMLRKGEVKLKIPEGFRLRNTPRTLELKRDFGSYSEKYEYDADERVLKGENFFKLEKVEFAADEYAELKKFIDEIAEAQRRLVILIEE